MNRLYSILAIAVGAGFLVVAVFLSVSVLKNRHKSVESIDIYRASRSRTQKAPGPTASDIDPEFEKEIIEKFKKNVDIEDGVPFDKFVNENIQLSRNPSEEEIDEYIKAVNDLAIRTDRVVINNCNPDPVVSRVAAGSQLYFFNEDEIGHEMYIVDPSFFLGSMQTSTFSVDFSSGAGIYNYDCDGHFSVGTLVVTQ